MNKVMSRTIKGTSRVGNDMSRPQPRPRHRPPTRHDTRRPGGAPPRTPSRTTRPQPPHTAPEAAERPRTAPQTAEPARGTPLPGTPRTAPQTAVTPPLLAVPRPHPRPRPTDLFADRLLAVLSGQRPVHWMLRHTAGRAYDDLARLAARGPLRARGTRPVVHDIGYYVAAEGAIEAFARISAGDQLRALAFRLELGADLRWRCTAVETAGPGSRPRSDG
ncbi:Rv3235 family protein [Streptomyces sp. NPDC127190]|uniref:Rv3235 family protein n=1 Tax=unclassified Streptomyces TaxID=2593676 RepID=UPI00364244B5